LAAFGWYFKKKIVFEKGKVGKDSEVSLTEMDKDNNLKNGVGI
jgi:hypothetical protein